MKMRGCWGLRGDDWRCDHIKERNDNVIGLAEGLDQKSGDGRENCDRLILGGWTERGDILFNADFLHGHEHQQTICRPKGSCLVLNVGWRLPLGEVTYDHLKGGKMHHMLVACETESKAAVEF
jgi:hypothetical protein